MKKIILTIEKIGTSGNAVWVATELGDREAEIVRLFGTNKLPTTFFASMPYDDVCEILKKRDPTAVFYNGSTNQETKE
jgi:hypothetical protein